MTIQQRTIGDLRFTHFTQTPGSEVPRHYHENGTCCVLLRGRARDYFRSRVIEYQPGAVIYRPPGEQHSHKFGHDGIVAIVIEVPPSRLLGDCALRTLSELRFEENASALTDIAQLLSYLRNPSVIDTEMEEHCLRLLTVFRLQGEEASGSEGLERVRTFLDECPVQRASLTELGQIADLHPAYLVNAFRKRYGCSIGHYRRRRRIAIAIGQIWDTQSPLSEIALASGFYDQSHCTNAMRKELQLTPLQLRSMIIPTFNSSNTDKAYACEACEAKR
jgi:AraC family transcriptional regulator